jgi:hypothetical protein
MYIYTYTAGSKVVAEAASRTGEISPYPLNRFWYQVKYRYLEEDARRYDSKKIRSNLKVTVP